MSTATMVREQPKLAPSLINYDKRYFPRWKVNKRVEYEKERMTFRSYTKDLSLDGASIVVFSNTSLSHLVQLKIHLTDKDILEIQGRVIWNKPESAFQLFGITFQKPSEKAQALMLTHAFELK